jgi:hypothetical protein
VFGQALELSVFELLAGAVAAAIFDQSAEREDGHVLLGIKILPFNEGDAVVQAMIAAELLRQVKQDPAVFNLLQGDDRWLDPADHLGHSRELPVPVGAAGGRLLLGQFRVIVARVLVEEPLQVPGADRQLLRFFVGRQRWGGEEQSGQNQKAHGSVLVAEGNAAEFVRIRVIEPLVSSRV